MLHIENTGIKSAGEKFQNTVLRPILKMCNDELINELRKFLLENEVEFEWTNIEEAQKFVLQLLKIKSKLFSSLNLIILDKLNFDEKIVFLKHKKELNKRLKEMLAQRLADNLSKDRFGKKGI